MYLSMELSHADTGHNLFDVYAILFPGKTLTLLAIFSCLLVFQMYEKLAVDVTRDLETWLGIDKLYQSIVSYMAGNASNMP